MAKQHRLSEIDRESRRAVCAVCGPTDVHVRKTGGRCECMAQRRKYITPLSPEGRERKRKRNQAWNKTSGRRTGPRTVEECAEAIARQGGRCAICKDLADRLVDDHDHTTGKARGMLCRHCNFLLGFARDRRLTLRNAIDYLDEHRSGT